MVRCFGRDFQDMMVILTTIAQVSMSVVRLSIGSGTALSIVGLL